MARKSADVFEKVAQIRALSQVKYEMALDTFNEQDAETQTVINKMVDTLYGLAMGTFIEDGQTVQVDDGIVGASVLWLAVEIVKDLALCGARVGNFTFPQSLCSSCGGPA